MLDIETLSYLTAAYIAFILGTMSSGPNVLSILNTAQKGRTQAIAVGLGMATGSLIWGVSSIIGLTVALLSIPSIVRVLQIFAACYLFWLAYKSFRAMYHIPADASSITSSKSILKYYSQGLIIQISNPKSAVTWLIVYSLAVSELENTLIRLLRHCGKRCFICYKTRLVRDFVLIAKCARILFEESQVGSIRNSYPFLCARYSNTIFYGCLKRRCSSMNFIRGYRVEGWQPTIFPKIMTIKGQRVYLRPLVTNDADKFVSAF